LSPGQKKKVENGFCTLGDLLGSLTKLENDSELRELHARIDEWRAHRNEAIHEMAKLGDTVRDPWSERVDAARRSARSGVELLLRLDARDRQLTHEGRSKDRSSATCPDALSPLGQPYCAWCTSTPSRRRKPPPS
jgi:hypothetical protein